jgi:NADH dehydrogenase (ubiquinone) 1 alpha subcomplex subunit 2
VLRGGADRKKVNATSRRPGLALPDPEAARWPDFTAFWFNFHAPTSSVAMSFARAFSPALREVRILFSQTGDASQGVRYARYRRISTSKCLTIVHRQFVVSTYPTLKKHNPDLPILLREAQGTPARAFARFGSLSTHACHTPYSENPAERGVERNVTLDGLSSKDVATKISELLG